MTIKTSISLLLLGGCLFLGCKRPDTVEPPKKCSKHTACSAGYKCNFHGENPSDPHAVGTCEYQSCGLTTPCKSPQPCLPDKEVAMCDEMDQNKFCGCVGPNSQDVPSTPTTSGGG